jgi:hypothetical protein
MIFVAYNMDAISDLWAEEGLKKAVHACLYKSMSRGAKTRIDYGVDMPD